jgi:hypothetical protein
MKRRDFITLLGGATSAWPIAAQAQQGERARQPEKLVPTLLHGARIRRSLSFSVSAKTRFGMVLSPASPGPGCSATGINFFVGEVVAKRLALLHDLVPKAVQQSTGCPKG